MMYDQKTYEAFIKRMEKKLVLALKEDERLRKVAKAVMDGIPYHTAVIDGRKMSMRPVPLNLKKANSDAWDAITKHELGVVNHIKYDIQNANKAISIIKHANYQIGELKFYNEIKTK